MDLKGPLDVQESVQKLSLLSLPRLHRVPLENITSPFFIDFQTRELGKEAIFLELILLGVKYFFWSTWAHKVSLCVLNLQFSLAKKVKFLSFAEWMLRPPSSLGRVTFDHPTQCIFLLASLEPHRKFLFILSKLFRILTGRKEVCIT